MDKHVVIFVMSPYKHNAEIRKYTCTKNGFADYASHTNETAVKYIKWKLAESGAEISDIYALVSKKVQTEDFPRFKESFADENFNLYSVPLQQDGELQGSFKSISKMFDTLSTASNNCQLTVHVDMTGGFRHSSVLILDLLQMIKYIGAKVGMVIYTNFDKQLVEEAGDLVSLFTLVAGTEEFASYGNVNQIKRYFAEIDNKSEILIKLLDTMEEFSERIKISSKLQNLCATIESLDQAIQKYKQFLLTADNISEQEEFFGKLLPTIEKEYASVISKKDDISSIPEIIKWCVNKGLLQQALTFYTERMPEFLVKSGLVTVLDKKAEHECKSKGKSWSCWEVYLFKSYVPVNSKNNLKGSLQNSTLSYENVRCFLEKNYTIDEISELLPDNNFVFADFLNQVKQLELKCYLENNYLETIMNLNENSLLKIILLKSKPENTSFERYIATRLKKTNQNIRKILFSAVTLLPKNYILELFNLKKTAEKIFCSRRGAFKMMLDNKVIATKLPETVLLQIVDDYVKNIINVRNNINHANGVNKGRVENYSISNIILKNITILEDYYK